MIRITILYSFDPAFHLIRHFPHLFTFFQCRRVILLRAGLPLEKRLRDFCFSQSQTLPCVSQTTLIGQPYSPNCITLIRDNKMIIVLVKAHPTRLASVVEGALNNPTDYYPLAPSDFGLTPKSSHSDLHRLDWDVNGWLAELRSQSSPDIDPIDCYLLAPSCFGLTPKSLSSPHSRGWECRMGPVQH